MGAAAGDEWRAEHPAARLDLAGADLAGMQFIGWNLSRAILDNAELKCWGSGSNGRLGYDSTDGKGDSAGEMASLGAVNLGSGRG